MSIMPLTLQRVKMLKYIPPSGQSQTVTTQTIIQMFREASGFEITPNKVLLICLLNTIQDKNMMVKVQEQMTKNMTGEEVRNIIIEIDNASCLSDVYKQNENRMWGQIVQPKTCQACSKKGYMVSACTVPK